MNHAVQWLIWTSVAAAANAFMMEYCCQMPRGNPRRLLGGLAFVVVLEIGKYMGSTGL